MREKAARADFGAFCGIPEVAAAFVSECIERTVTEQAVEILRISALVTRKVLAVAIGKECMIMKSDGTADLPLFLPE